MRSTAVDGATHMLYPGLTALGGVTHWPVKVWVHEGRFKVYADPGGVVTLLLDEPATEFVRAGSQWHVTLADGTRVSVRRKGGCGCNHPALKRSGPDGA